MVTAVSGNTFSIGEEGMVSVELLGKELNGNCGMINMMCLTCSLK